MIQGGSYRMMSIERSTGKKEYLKQKAYHRAPMNLSLRISCLLAAIIGVASSKGSVSVLYRRVVSTTAACLLPLCIAPPIVTAASTAPKVSAVSSSVDLATQLKNMQTAQEALDAQDVEYTLLPLGESYREFRVGRGSRSVEQGSPVTAEMTIRCKKFPTQKEPGGVKYYDSKIDTKDKQLAWTIGDGSVMPAIEEALVGAKKGAVRRIEVPSQLVFRARKEGNLPLPSPSNEDGNRRFKNLFKTDATVIAEVLIKDITSPASTAAILLE